MAVTKPDLSNFVSIWADCAALPLIGYRSLVGLIPLVGGATPLLCWRWLVAPGQKQIYVDFFSSFLKSHMAEHFKPCVCPFFYRFLGYFFILIGSKTFIIFPTSQSPILNILIEHVMKWALHSSHMQNNSMHRA